MLQDQQLVGGTGGIGGTGTARFQTSQLGTGTVAVSVGGGAQTSGNGGDVTLNALLDIRTEGNNAYGVLAQSIGGGGGLGFIQEGVPASYVLGARTATQSNGGVVSLTLADGSTITTSGAGSARRGGGLWQPRPFCSTAAAAAAAAAAKAQPGPFLQPL